MNKIIKDQLNKVRSVKLSFDDNTTQILIPKSSEVIPEALNQGDVYLINLNDKILNPSSNSTLAANWNSGRVPNHKLYKVEFLEKMGNMYKFNGIAVEDGVDLYNENWFGWIPEDCFKVEEKL